MKREKGYWAVIRYHLNRSCSFRAMNRNSGAKCCAAAGRPWRRWICCITQGSTDESYCVKVLMTGMSWGHGLEKHDCMLHYWSVTGVVPVGLTNTEKVSILWNLLIKKIRRKSSESDRTLAEDHGGEVRDHFIHRRMSGIFWRAGEKLPCGGIRRISATKNGVGMVRLLETEVKKRRELTGDRGWQAGSPQENWRHLFIALAARKSEKFPQYCGIPVTTIENRFFGEKITVSGLITGPGSERTAFPALIWRKLWSQYGMRRWWEIFWMTCWHKNFLRAQSRSGNCRHRTWSGRGCDQSSNINNRRRQIYEQTSEKPSDGRG